MWNGKHKALTFSFDDGVTQDETLVKILNDNGLKSTFNLNSGLLGTPRLLNFYGRIVDHNKIAPEKVASLYAGHEVAVHTLTHRRLPTLPDEEIIRELEEDRKALEKLVGYKMRGMAYPEAGENYNEHVLELVRAHTPLRYARTIQSTYSFDLQTDLLRFNPTVYYIELEKLFELAQKFLDLQTEKDQILYIWGHSFEVDAKYLTWKDFERLCKMLSNKADIFYGTNAQVLLND